MTEYLGSRAYEILARGNLFPTTVRERVVAVGATAVEVAPTNPRRVSMTVVNQGANPVYLSFDTSLVPTSGVWLSANGGSLVMTVAEDLEATTWLLYAACPAATVNVYVMEIVAL